MDVLHIRVNEDFDPRTLTGAFISRGNELSVHVDNPDGSVDIYNYRREDGRSRVTVRSATSILYCGCP